MGYAQLQGMNPNGIVTADFVTPTEATQPCEGVQRLGVVLEAMDMPLDGFVVTALMVHWFCCKRTMLADARHCRLVDPISASRQLREWGRER